MFRVVYKATASKSCIEKIKLLFQGDLLIMIFFTQRDSANGCFRHFYGRAVLFIMPLYIDAHGSIIVEI